MAERPSSDDQATAISGTLLDCDDGGFAGLVPLTTDKDQLDGPVPCWMMPIALIPAALDLRSVALPALQLPNVEQVETGSLELKTLVAFVDECGLPGGILTPSPAQANTSVEFVEGAVSPPPESTEPAAFKMPEPFPAVPLPEMGMALNVAPELLPAEAEIGGPAPDDGPPSGTAFLSALPPPLQPVLPDPALPQATVAAVPAVATGNGSAGLTNSLSCSPDRAGTSSVVDPRASPKHEIQRPTALMLRFESEGRAVPVRPLVLADMQTSGERPLIHAFRPEIVNSAPFADLPEPDPKLIADPRMAERLGPDGIATTLVPAHARLPPVVLAVAKDEDDDGMTELTVHASNPGQSAGVGAKVSPAESQKTAVPILSPLVGQVINAVVKAADGATTLTLSPEGLGKVRLSFRPDKQNADKMVVMLGFDRSETMELFRRHANELADALRAAGYAGVQIDFGGTRDGKSRQLLDLAQPVGAEGDDMALADEAVPLLTPLRHRALGGLDLRL